MSKPKIRQAGRFIKQNKWKDRPGSEEFIDWTPYYANLAVKQGWVEGVSSALCSGVLMEEEFGIEAAKNGDDAMLEFLIMRNCMIGRETILASIQSDSSECLSLCLQVTDEDPSKYLKSAKGKKCRSVLEN